MNLKKGIRAGIYVTLASFMMVTSNNGIAQVSDMAIASTADTSHFSPNTKDGWGILLGYANGVGRDSARLEIVLFREQSLNLEQSKLIGWMRSKEIRPSVIRLCSVQIGQRQFELKIEPNGYVWLRASAGPPLEAGKMMLPMVILYKR